MVMHSPHDDGGWGVCANRVSRLGAFWNTKARFVAWLGHLPKEAQAIWLPNNDLAVPEDWQQPGLLQLTKAHAGGDDGPNHHSMPTHHSLSSMPVRPPAGLQCDDM